MSLEFVLHFKLESQASMTWDVRVTFCSFTGTSVSVYTTSCVRGEKILYSCESWGFA